MQTSGSAMQSEPIGSHVAIGALALTLLLGVATLAYAWLPESATGCYVSLYSDPTPLIAATGNYAAESLRCDRCTPHSVD
jgi:hypothetical protein